LAVTFSKAHITPVTLKVISVMTSFACSIKSHVSPRMPSQAAVDFIWSWCSKEYVAELTCSRPNAWRISLVPAHMMKLVQVPVLPDRKACCKLYFSTRTPKILAEVPRLLVLPCTSSAMRVGRQDKLPAEASWFGCGARQHGQQSLSRGYRVPGAPQPVTPPLATIW
jgi:hypothetical protein